jgi:hypothetical protein
MNRYRWIIPELLIGLLTLLTVGAGSLGLSEAPKVTPSTASSATHAHSFSTASGTGSDMVAVIGDLIVLLALLSTYVIFRVQQRTSENLQIDSTVSALNGVRHGMGEWAQHHFGGDGWPDGEAVRRAELDYKKIVGILEEEPVVQVPQNFRVPKEPLVALVEHSESLALLDVETLKIANEALRRVEIFNQFIQMQTDFNIRHFHEILDTGLDPARRENIARSSQTISLWIHRDAIGNAGWYKSLMKAMDDNLTHLASRKREHWWSRRPKPSID